MHLRGAGNTIITCKNLQVQHTLIRKDLGYWEYHDTQTGMPFGIPKGARCVQRFDDSLNSAIHITYRSSLRSSSMGEPRDPLLKVVFILRSLHYGAIKIFQDIQTGVKNDESRRAKNSPKSHLERRTTRDFVKGAQVCTSRIPIIEPCKWMHNAQLNGN